MRWAITGPMPRRLRPSPRKRCPRMSGTTKEKASTRCRIYAPVGAHSDLLAYLVRRLLENGANGSFVNQIVDPDVSPERISRDPVETAAGTGFVPNPAIAVPERLFATRCNSRGWDLTDPLDLAAIEAGRAPFAAPWRWQAAPLTPLAVSANHAVEIRNPARPDEAVGTLVEADAALAAAAVTVAL